MLLLVKIVHTISWVIVFSAILYILFSGIMGIIDNSIWIAITIVIVEGIILLVNKWNCPLTSIAQKYSNNQSDNFDIFLPDWLAKHTKTIGAIIFTIGLLLILINHIKNFLNN